MRKIVAVLAISVFDGNIADGFVKSKSDMLSDLTFDQSLELRIERHIRKDAGFDGRTSSIRLFFPAIFEFGS